jgi:polar amino acid transport system permease protein
VDRIADQFLNGDALAASTTLLWLGLGQTTRLVAATMLVALLGGFVVAWSRTHRTAFLRAIAIVYIDLARTTPPLVSLVVVAYGLSIFGLPSLGTFGSAVLALGLLHSAHVGEIYRGGMLAVNHGQREAARALALSNFQAARSVLAPQAARAVIPPLTSQVTQIVRDSPLALMIGYAELLTRAREAQALTANSTAIAATAVVFIALLLGLQMAAALMARRWRRRTGTPARVGVA